jgi:hypothetical protein
MNKSFWKNNCDWKTNADKKITLTRCEFRGVRREVWENVVPSVEGRRRNWSQLDQCMLRFVDPPSDDSFCPEIIAKMFEFYLYDAFITSQEIKLLKKTSNFMHQNGPKNLKKLKTSTGFLIKTIRYTGKYMKRMHLK